MTDVIKRNKRRQKYSIKKLERSLERAMKDAKVVAAKRKKLMHEVAHTLHGQVLKKRSVKSDYLKRSILSRMAPRSKATVRAWQRYNKRKK